jgi:outer membrane receptor protein involved in Fe transport
MLVKPHSRKKILSFAVSAALGVAGSQGWAQELEEEALDAAAVSEEESVEEVIVTGSRIIRDGYSSASPMDVISADTAVVQGIADVGSLLQTTTIASGSAQVTTATSSAFVQEGGIGTSTISLRGLGAARTLVLLNGRRIGPAGVRGQVSSFDLNLMPIVAVDRIEILKDGASTVYGSDAVAGVVNVITRKDDGFGFDAYTAQPTDSGGAENRLSLRWGNSFDKGHFSIMGDFIQRKELKKGNRDYFDCGEQYVFDPDTGDRADIVDPRTGSPHCNDLRWGHIWIYDYSGLPGGTKAQYDYDGDLGNYIPGFQEAFPGQMEAPAGWFPVDYSDATSAVTNADHPFQDGSSLVPKTEVYTLYADAEYQLTDDLTMYGEVLMSRRETYVNSYRQFWTYIYNEDFFAGSSLSQGWRGAQWLSPTPITDHSDDSVEVSYGRALLGFSGSLGDYSWDISGQYSRSDGDYISDQIYDDSVTSSWFQTGSCVGQTTSVRGVPCMDPRWLDQDFNNGVLTPEERAFLFGTETGNTEYTQWSIEGTVSGPLFDLPAGEVLGAIGFQYREDEIKDVPGEITLANNAWGASGAGITEGDDSTTAIFGEIEIPVISDVPLIHNLMVNASARYTDVDSYGSDSTWKVGVNWELTPDVRVRASSGTSFRTPALYELYLANQTSFTGQRSVDPCIRWGTNLQDGSVSQRLADNCAADGIAPDFTGAPISATIVTGGGLGVLEAETSEATTIGIVWQPDFANLSISADFFDIKIEDQVSQLGASTIVSACYNSDFFPNDPLCALFERRALDQGVDNIRDSYINVAEQRNRGWDLAATWVTDTPVGMLTLETQHTFQIEDTVALFEDTAQDFNGEVGEPKWTGRVSAALQNGAWSGAWVANIIGDSSNYDSYGGNTVSLRGREVRVVLDTDTVVYHNASVAYSFDNGATVRLGVSNIFDKEPPRLTTLNLGEVTTQGNSAFYSQYDWEGRTIFANLRWEM